MCRLGMPVYGRAATLYPTCNAIAKLLMNKRTVKPILAAFSALTLLWLNTGLNHAYAQSFEQVAVGSMHICALDSAGQVECTTAPGADRFSKPNDLPLMSEITAGQQHTCGITLDGNVECWGVNFAGVLDVPVFNAPVVDIAAGFNHTCAVDAENRAQCWGLNTNSQLDVPETAGGFIKVAAAENYSCGIESNGDIVCWTTDFEVQAGTVIPGPFLDLDLSSTHACGIRGTGDIECWLDLTGSNQPNAPGNGPYIDLVASNFAICGLTTDQLLDCSFGVEALGFSDRDSAISQFPLDERFSSIERSIPLTASFNFIAPLCGVRADTNTLTCFGDGGAAGLPAPPGASPMAAPVAANNIILGLTAQVYDVNALELFWNRVPHVVPAISVEVHRDGELLTTTNASFSFFDTETVSNEETRYRVRTVDAAGNLGEFSNEVIVNRQTRQVLIGDTIVAGSVPAGENPRPVNASRIGELTFTPLNFFNRPNRDSLILNWDFVNLSDATVAGFEIRVDGEVVGFTSSTLFVDDQLTLDSCRIYSVAAIADDGAILDFRSIVYNVRQSDVFRCTQGLIGF